MARTNWKGDSAVSARRIANAQARQALKRSKPLVRKILESPYLADALAEKGLTIDYAEIKHMMDGEPWEDFDKFGEWCDSVWMGKHPMEERDLIIATMGICGEAGEVSEKIKKEIRDGTDAKAAGVLKELGDVIFYACTIARYYGYKPSDILKANYDKLESRMARGTQRGSGDSR